MYNQQFPIKRLWILALFPLWLLPSGCDDGGHGDDPLDAAHPVPFRAEGDYIEVWEGTEYRPIFIKGMNLGVGVPGTQPGELAISEDQYQRWLLRMGEMGINTLRIYTLHYPRFYEAFRDYNMSHPTRPIYLLHGIWLDEENPDPNGDLYGLTDAFDDSIEEVIDCVYGNRAIAERYGRAHGDYTVDVSKWVMGWLIGREIIPYEVDVTDASHPGNTEFQGSSLRLPEGTPSETWIAARLDKVVTYEKEEYGFQRPISISSWPTLDPLTHPTESTYSSEDWMTVDLADIELLDAPGGVFYSFHAYPYYPDFVNDAPAYREFQDADGINNYLGYLSSLKDHYSDRPLLIAEFGVPSSWGNAHDSLSGMNHGGHDEQAQGRYDARQLNTIFDAGCAGGALFAWMDEWWKRTWITDELDLPRSRYPIWWNVTAAEQNFGLIAFEPPAPTYSNIFSSTTFRIREISAAATNPFFYVNIILDSAPMSGEQLTIGFDTYRTDLGESVLPNGTTTELRAELALTVNTLDTAQLYVTQAYDLFGIWHGTSTDKQQYHSTVSDGDPWMPVRWQNNGARTSADGQTEFSASQQDIGSLSIRENTKLATSLDAVVIDKNSIRVRLPWTLLQFTDPSSLSVMDDDRATIDTETATTDGIALTVVIGDQSVETIRYSWQPWDLAPETEEREKASLEIFAAALEALPTYIQE